MYILRYIFTFTKHFLRLSAKKGFEPLLSGHEPDGLPVNTI